MFLSKINNTIKLLIISDIFLLTGFGLVGPIFSIFIKDNLQGGTIFAAGLASFIFLITKSIIQIPFSKYIDKHDHKIKFLILGTFLIAIVPFIYIFSENIYMIFIAQFIYGVGAGFSYPCWFGLFSLNLDKHHESFEWSIYGALVSIGAAISAAIGGIIAQYIGFKITFLFGGVLALFGSFILFFLTKKNEKQKKLNLRTSAFQKRARLKGAIIIKKVRWWKSALTFLIFSRYKTQ